MGDYPKDAWLRFLQARADMVDQMTERGLGDAAIARELSMDAAQVNLIRARERHLDQLTFRNGC